MESLYEFSGLKCTKSQQSRACYHHNSSSINTFRRFMKNVLFLRVRAHKWKSHWIETVESTRLSLQMGSQVSFGTRIRIVEPALTKLATFKLRQLRVQTLGRSWLRGSAAPAAQIYALKMTQDHSERARFTHLGLEMDPVLVRLLVVERHPRVRHIVHQVVPVPRRHHGNRRTDRRRWSFGSTRRRCPDPERASPVRDSRASPAVSWRRGRSPLLLPWAWKGPIL